MLYCFGLDYLPVSLVVTLSNLYIVITIVLGIVVLHEPVTGLKIAGLICIVARPGARDRRHPHRRRLHQGRRGRARYRQAVRSFLIGILTRGEVCSLSLTCAASRSLIVECLVPHAADLRGDSDIG